MRKSDTFFISNIIFFLIVCITVVSINFQKSKEKPMEYSPMVKEVNSFIYDVYSDEYVPLNLIPTYIPEGYSIIKKDYYEDDMDIIASIRFEKSGTKEFINHRVYYNLTNNATTSYEKDNNEVTHIEKDGIIYYLFSNVDTNSIVWRNGAFETHYEGTLTRDQLKDIIASIPSKS